MRASMTTGLSSGLCRLAQPFSKFSIEINPSRTGKLLHGEQRFGLFDDDSEVVGNCENPEGRVFTCSLSILQRDRVDISPSQLAEQGIKSPLLIFAYLSVLPTDSALELNGFVHNTSTFGVQYIGHVFPSESV
jgi:hypothetical protein